MSANGNSRLGSGVLPLDAGSKPPTNERGTVSSLIQGYLQQWQTLDAQDELETNLKLTFPESITSYHNMRTDPQVQGLLTGAVWPLLRMRWYIDPNGAPDEQVEHISADYNLPIEDPNAPMMAAVPQQLTEFDQENTDRPANPVSGAAAPVPRQQKPTPPPQPILMQAPPPVFHQRRTQIRFNFLEHLETALDAIAYGFMAFEQVGYIGSDGLWHLRKLGLRPPQTI